MIAFLARLLCAAVIAASFGGAARAQDKPLALPPVAADAADAAPIVITAPTEPSGLALPPPASPPKPVAIDAPVETEPLGEIKGDSIGLLANNEGGLGAGLWKGTPRVLVEHFMPMLSLPTPYASLNDLAGRFLATTAAAPEGTAGSGPSLTSLRVDRLVALGAAAEAWKLANLAGGEQVDDSSLRQAAEAALVGDAAADVCAKLPEIVKKHTGGDWLKPMAICQLQANDTKAAQLSIDLLHAQEAHDDTFFALAEKNVIGGGKQLPRQLTPLKPLTLALVRLTDLPVRSEVFARPDAALIPALLKTKTLDESARLALGERAAMRGLIDAAQLADLYRGQTFTPDNLASADISGEHGPVLRALLYQASQKETNPKNRIAQTVKFLQSLDSGSLGGAMLPLLGAMIGDAQPAPDFAANAAAVARIYVLSGNSSAAMSWLAFARNAARGMPAVAEDLQQLWPLAVLGGFQSEADFPKDLDAWTTAALRGAADQPDSAPHTPKANAAAILLLLDAVGFPIDDATWVKCADAPLYEKIPMPPPFVMERLREAGAGKRKGEAILMGLLATAGGKDDPPLFTTLETIRALRRVGLTGDAANLAKDVALRVLYPAAKP